MLSSVRRFFELLGYFVNVVFLYDLITGRGLLSFLSSSIGEQAVGIYNVLVLLAIVGATTIPLYMGYNLRGWRNSTAIVYRKDLQEIPDILNKVKSEIYVLSITNEVFRQYIGDIVNLLKNNKRITFLFLSKGNKELIQRIEEAFNSANTAEIIDGTISMLQKAKENTGLNPEQAKNLKIMTYEAIPIHGIIAIDPESIDAKMQVEFYAYRHDPTSRVNLLLSKKRNPSLFKLYWTSLSFILEHSIELSQATTLTERSTAESGLADFKAEIREKKKEYRRGGEVLFRTYYRGSLTNGFFDNEIYAPEGKTFSNGDERKWSWPRDTLPNDSPDTKGLLNGHVNKESKWSWRIPDDAPLGTYKAFMAVREHHHAGEGGRPVIEHKEDIFLVV